MSFGQLFFFNTTRSPPPAAISSAPAALPALDVAQPQQDHRPRSDSATAVRRHAGNENESRRGYHRAFDMSGCVR